MSQDSNPSAPSASGRHTPWSVQGRPSPVAGERDFGPEESFFSTTDPKGIIRSGNQVFARVSGYTSDELIGSPHNLIRHPDMPRAVFQILWEEIGAGRPLAAYVKNLAKDGRYYWVMASVLPCPGGYLSVRIKPSTPIFDIVQPLYRDLWATEHAVENGEPRRRQAAIVAARELLDERLKAAGYPSYEAFMRAALLAEVKTRTARLKTLPPPPSPRPDADPNLVRMLSAGASVSTFVDSLVVQLDDYATLNQTLLEKGRALANLGEEIRRAAANTEAVADQTGGGETALRAIGGAMSARAADSGPTFMALQRDAAEFAEQLAGMFFPVAAASLQAEILNVFVRELLAKRGGTLPTTDDLGALASCLTEEVARLSELLIGLDGRLGLLSGHISRLQADLGAIRALQLKGRIAVTRGGQVGAVDALFQSTADQIRTARRELDRLLSTGRGSIREAATQARQSREHIDTIRKLVTTLGLA